MPNCLFSPTHVILSIYCTFSQYVVVHPSPISHRHSHPPIAAPLSLRASSLLPILPSLSFLLHFIFLQMSSFICSSLSTASDDPSSFLYFFSSPRSPSQDPTNHIPHLIRLLLLPYPFLPSLFLSLPHELPPPFPPPCSSAAFSILLFSSSLTFRSSSSQHLPIYRSLLHVSRPSAGKGSFSAWRRVAVGVLSTP